MTNPLYWPRGERRHNAQRVSRTRAMRHVGMCLWIVRMLQRGGQSARPGGIGSGHRLARRHGRSLNEENDDQGKWTPSHLGMSILGLPPHPGRLRHFSVLGSTFK